MRLMKIDKKKETQAWHPTPLIVSLLRSV